MPRDLLLVNARIWTGDRSAPWADTARASDGRFVAVGQRADVDGSGAEELDAGGRLVVPGFIDAHAHLLNTGFAMSGVDLKAAPSLEEALQRIERRAASLPDGAWLRGAGWDQNDWPGGGFPDRHQLDAVTGARPAVLTHTSGHCAWVNSAALNAAGIGATTEPPEGGVIQRDAAGAPTGILLDNASRLLTGAMPAPLPDERIAAVQQAVSHAHALGITGAHAMDVGRGEYQALLNLRETARLRLRVRAYLTASRLDEWRERAVRTGDGDAMFRIGGVKFFSDGALGSLTAWMHEPYEGRDDTGLPLQSAEHLEKMVREAMSAGLAPAIHAIGDRANSEVLDIYERLPAAPDTPRRIEHAQLLRAADIARFARLGVVASVQPIHATQDMRKVDREWGARGRGAYAFASLLRAGATLAFGSDTPVETMSPFAGLHAAVTRRNGDGEPAEGWYPDERLTLDDALRAYTAGSAAAAGETATAGRIAQGCDADFVVLSRDLFALEDVMDMSRTEAAATIVAGEIVHRAPNF